MTGDFSNGPDRQKRNEFPKGRVELQKRKTNNIARQPGPAKQRQSFQIGGLNINNESYVVDNKCKCSNEMCLSVFIKGFKQKSFIFLLLLSTVSILHLVCYFHISDLIIAFIIDFKFLYLAESNEY